MIKKVSFKIISHANKVWIRKIRLQNLYNLRQYKKYLYIFELCNAYLEHRKLI